MNWTNLLFPAGSLLVAYLAYNFGVKKSSNESAAQSARFQGEISEKINTLQKSVDKLEIALTKSTDDIYAEIKRSREEHERVYHSG